MFIGTIDMSISVGVSTIHEFPQGVGGMPDEYMPCLSLGKARGVDIDLVVVTRGQIYGKPLDF